jgi:DNA repair exonuclease SbcCD ATPase subunit
MENVGTAFRNLRNDQRKAEKRLNNYENESARRLQQPGLTADSLVSELKGLVGRRTQLETVLQRTRTETGRFGFLPFFGPPKKKKIDALRDNIENFSTRLHAISTTLNLDIPNAVIRANIEAPFQSRYLDLLNQHTDAEAHHQGFGWTQQSLNGEIREIADRRWELERLRQEIGSSAANGFELFRRPNEQRLATFEQGLTEFEGTVRQAAERNQLNLNAAREIAESDHLLRQTESALNEGLRTWQSEPGAPEIQWIRDQQERARQLLADVQGIRDEGGDLLEGTERRVNNLMQELRGHEETLQGFVGSDVAGRNRLDIRRMEHEEINGQTLPPYTRGALLPEYRTVGPRNQPPLSTSADAESPAGVVAAEARRSATPEPTRSSISL